MNLFKLDKYTNTCIPQLLIETAYHFLSSPPSSIFLCKSLLNLDCLLFIQYVPDNSLKSNLFLVQINHKETKFLNMNVKSISDYHVTCISRCLDDSNLCDDKFDKVYNPVYSDRIHFRPKRKPDLKLKFFGSIPYI